MNQGREFPIPPDEVARLQGVRDLRILDTPSDPTFNRITEFASRAFGVPISIISLIDSDRQWFKSSRGLDVSAIPRAISICAHTILGDAPLVVPDLREDPRFRDNPLIGSEGLIFYAGRAIHDRSGNRVGTFAILDRRRRDLDASEIGLIDGFAAWAEFEIQRGGEAYGRLFEEAPVALWVEDFSRAGAYLEEIRASGVADIRSHLTDHPEDFDRAVGLVRVVDANTRAARLLDAPSKLDLLGTRLYQTISEGARQSFIDRFEAMWNDSTVVEGIYIFRTQIDRPIRCNLTWSVPEHGGRHDYSRALLALVDTTSQWEIEEALTASERRYRDLFKNLPLAMVITSPEGDIIDANPAAVELYGASSLEELMSVTAARLYSRPAERELFVRALDESDVIVRPAVQSLRMDGTEILVRSVTRAVRSRSGKVLYVESMMEDVTERHQTERRAIRLAEILEHTSDLVAISNWEGDQLFFVNGAGRRILGITAETGLSQLSAMSFYTPDTQEKFRAEIIPALRESSVWEGELDVKTEGGALLPTSQVVVAHRGPTGRISHVSTVARDLSSYKRAEEELRESRDRLAEMVRSKDEFLASISHEIRTPLSVVVGLAYELSEHLSSFSPEELTELAGHVYAQSTELSHIVEDLLVAARADTGSLAAHPVSIEIKAVTEKLIAEISPIVDSSRISVSGRSSHAWADPYRIRQILRNLFTNAARYGGTEIIVKIADDERTTYVRVADNGLGVPTGQEETIFEPYSRAHESRGRPGSVGLGLSVSRTLARLMDGDLVYRREGDMSVFELSLPAAPP